MVLANGKVVHNVRRVQWNRPDAAFPWKEHFEEAVAAQLRDEPADALSVLEHPDYDEAVPTPDYFIPLLHTAGLAAAGESKADAIVRGYVLRSLSMTCYGIGTDVFCPRMAEDAATLPPGVPADQSNI